MEPTLVTQTVTISLSVCVQMRKWKASSMFWIKMTKPANIIVAWCYDCCPGDRSEETLLDVDWSILTPFPSYTSHAPESFKDNPLCIHNDHLPHIPRTFCIPHTVTYPADNSVKRVLYDRFDHTQPGFNLNDSFNDTYDIGMTFLGPKLHDPNALFNLEYSFPMNSLGFVTGQLVDGQNVECLIDTGVIHSITSRAFYEACPSLAKLPRYKPIHPYCVVSNGQRVRVLYTIPVVISFGIHQFEIFTQVNDTLAYEIYVTGIKSLVEIEAVINTRISEVSFLSRSAPVFPFATETVPTKGKKLIKSIPEISHPANRNDNPQIEDVLHTDSDGLGCCPEKCHDFLGHQH